MSGIQEKLITISGTTSATALYQPTRSGPMVISMSGTGSPTVAFKVGDSPTATDGPALQVLDNSGAATVANNEAATLICPPKYLILSATAAGAFVANVRIQF